jgi:hypothetical protein
MDEGKGEEGGGRGKGEGGEEERSVRGGGLGDVILFRPSPQFVLSGASSTSLNHIYRFFELESSTLVT